MRKRRCVTVVPQKHDFDCGVAALASLYSIPYGDVSAVARALFGTTKPTKRGLGLYHLEEMAEALGRPLRRIYRRPDYLESRTGVLGLNGGSMCWAGHWTVLKNGVIVDPDGGEVWTVSEYLRSTGSKPATLLVEA